MLPLDLIGAGVNHYSMAMQFEGKSVYYGFQVQCLIRLQPIGWPGPSASAISRPKNTYTGSITNISYNFFGGPLAIGLQPVHRIW